MADSAKQRLRPKSLPVVYKQGGSGKVVKQGEIPVVRPNAGEVGLYGNQRVRTCAECKNFAPEMLSWRERWEFGMRLVREENWKLSHIGHHIKEIARCREDATLVVGPTSRACDHFTPKR